MPQKVGGGGVTYALEASANEVDTNKEWKPEGSIIAQGEDGVPWELYENGYLLFKPEQGKDTLSNLRGEGLPSWKKPEYGEKTKAIGFTDKVYLPEDSSDLFGCVLGSCSLAKFLDTSKIDTSKVNNMSRLFAFSHFKEINLDSWDTSNVTNMTLMFEASLVEKLNISNLNTKNVKSMNGMFSNIGEESLGFKDLDLSKWDTSNLTDIHKMFIINYSIETINVSNWDTSKITTMQDAFSGAHNLKEIKGIENWDTSNVTTIRDMFAVSEKLTSLNLSKWNTSNIEDMSSVFVGSEGLTYLNIENWDTSKVESFDNIFSNTALTHLKIGNKFSKTKLTDNLFKTLDEFYPSYVSNDTKKHNYKWTRLDKTTSFYTVDEWNKEYRANPDKLAGMWVREKNYNGYDIIFETDTDETINPIEVEIGTNVELPTPSVLKPNHSFVGWSKTQDGEVIADTTNLGNKNETVTLYAKWKKNQTEDNSNPIVLKLVAPKDDENKTNITNNASTTPILPPTVDKPEYTGTLSTNTPVDNNGDLILPPIHNKEEYTQPIGTNTPIDNDGNLILPPIVNIPEYKNKIKKQKNANENMLQPVTDKIKTNTNIDDKNEITTNNVDKSDGKQNVKETNIAVTKNEHNNNVVQKQVLPKTNAFYSTPYVIGLLLSAIGLKQNKKD